MLQRYKRVEAQATQRKALADQREVLLHVHADELRRISADLEEKRRQAELEASLQTGKRLEAETRVSALQDELAHARLRIKQLEREVAELRRSLILANNELGDTKAALAQARTCATRTWSTSSGALFMDTSMQERCSHQYVA